MAVATKSIASAKNTRVVIVEDDHILSKYLAARFKQDGGFTVMTAGDGEEGEALIRKELPDIVLLDIIMPKRTGFEVLESIKKTPETKQIPVLVLSNLGQEADIARAKELGAADYVVKVDFGVKEIVEKVKKFLNKGI